ncbi:MAG: Na/Pi symporter [Thermoanaerobaculia bacterium]
MARSLASPTAGRRRAVLLRVVAAAALLFVFLLGVNGLGDGFKLLGRDFVQTFFRATSNPFIGLILGVLATTLVQSSSVTTSMIVGMVAAPENPLPLANAVPMIMGANIGTTVTNTLVSLAHIGRKAEFRRAFAAATCHDFFNYLTVLVLLPLELATGYLRRTAGLLTGLVTGAGARGVEYESPISGALEWAFTPVERAAAFFDSQAARAALIIAVSAVLIVISLLLLVGVMRALLIGRVETGLVGALGQSGIVAMVVGVIATVMVQSSSITTSLLVPLAGAGIVTLDQVFPITVGANIGTTVTALLASLAVTGPNAEAGVTIALVHLLFNLTGAVFIYGIPAVRRIPLYLARRLAIVAVRSRAVAIAYVAGMFYGIPAVIAIVDIMLL